MKLRRGTVFSPQRNLSISGEMRRKKEFFRCLRSTSRPRKIQYFRCRRRELLMGQTQGTIRASSETADKALITVARILRRCCGFLRLRGRWLRNDGSSLTLLLPRSFDLTRRSGHPLFEIFRDIAPFLSIADHTRRDQQQQFGAVCSVRRGDRKSTRLN